MLYFKTKRLAWLNSARAVVHTLLVSLLAMASMLSTSVHAAAVTGQLSFVTSFSFIEDGSGAEIGVDFINFAPPTGADGIFDTDASSANVTVASGDFAGAGISAGSTITLRDFLFDLSVVNNPVASVGDFDFFVTSVVPPAVSAGTGQGDFSGSGYLVDNLGNFVNTDYTFNFNNVQGTVSVVTQTATGVPAVPVPAAVWFMGSALAGLAGARRLRR